MSKRRKYLPEEKIKIVKSFAVQIRIQPIVECDFPINVLGYLSNENQPWQVGGGCHGSVKIWLSQ